MGSDGNTYEKQAILQWLRANPHSPMTRQPMSASSLKPNYALRSAIERYNSQPVPSSARPEPAYTEYRPIVVPTAPPADDVYVAFQVHQQVNVVPSSAQADIRRKKLLSACFCFIIIIITIIVASRIFLGTD